MLTTVIAAAAMGVIAGALGAVVGALLGKIVDLARSGEGRSIRVLAAIGALVGFVAINSTSLPDTVARRVYPHVAFMVLGLEIQAMPEYRERTRGKSPEEAQAIATQLAAAGLLRIDDAQVVHRAQLLADMLSSADEETCGRFALSRTTSADIMNMTLALPLANQQAWVALARSAILAELRPRAEARPALPSPTEIGDALFELEGGLALEQRARLTANLQALSILEPYEACWTVRRLYGLVAGSSGRTQTIAARALVMN